MQRLGEVIDATPETSETDKKPWAKISDQADVICSNLLVIDLVLFYEQTGLLF